MTLRDAMLLMVLALPWWGCSSKDASTTSAAPPRPETPAATSSSQETSFVSSGPIVVENQVDVAAQREGVIAKISADIGDRVKSGQVLALLDDRQISWDLDAARAKTRSIEADLKNWKAEAVVLESDYRRAQKMWEAQLITQEQLEHARFKAESDRWDVQRVQELLVSAQATERSLELEHEKTRIRAPFDGVVARRYVRAGQKVAIGDRMFWVTGQGSLRARFTLPSQFLGKVKKGQDITLAAPDLPGEKHAARIIEISPVVDPASGTIEVLAQVTGPQGELRPGMTVNVRLQNPQ